MSAPTMMGKANRDTAMKAKANLLHAVAVLGAATFATPVLAQSFVIEGAWVEVGDGTVLDEANVVVQDGRITAVGKGATAPAGAARIDGRGKVVAPGFVEARTQLGLFEVELEVSTVDTQHQGRTESPAFHAYDGFNPHSVRIPVEREEGVTTVVASPTGTLIYGTGFRTELDGKLPESLEPALPVAMFGGIGERAAYGIGQARGAVWWRMRQIVDDTFTYKTSRRDYDKGSLRKLSLTREELETMVPVIEGRIPLVLHANRASDILAALRLKEDVKRRGGKLRLVISGAAEGWLVADALKKADVPVIITPSEQYLISFEQLRARDDNPVVLDKAGVKVVLSSYTWANNVRRMRQEAGIAVSYGMDRNAALAAITSRPAEVFGFDDIGRVAVGKRANLSVFSGDPLELSTVVEKVFIDGEEMSLNTRQRALAERYKKRAGK